jgi:polyisoprenyl-teichoic acid--peptidoglycan teichoic acid transferase
MTKIILQPLANKPDESEHAIVEHSLRPQIMPLPIPKRKSRSFLFKLSAYFFIFVLTCVAVFTSQILISKDNSVNWISNLPGLKQIQYLAEGANSPLKGEDRDRINIVLLGIGGKGHDGAYLTDTIMLVSLQPSTKKVSMVSIPRDMVVPIENMGWRKVNSINSFAELKIPGSGGLAVSQSLSDILGTPIDYFLRVDFDGFVNIIDQLGGVEVDVDNTLDDYNYPVLGNEDATWNTRWEHLHIDKGWQKMDGALALKYARSRHGLGVEGSDFARAKRQQKIIEAVKEKVISMDILFKPTMISNIIQQLEEHISTNLQVWEMVRIWEIFKDVQKGSIINKVIDNGPDGLLVNSVGEDGAYILTPKSGDFSDIKYLVDTIFDQNTTESKDAIITEEKPEIEVRNGTWINGLATKVAVDLEKSGFKIIRVGNSSQQNFRKTVIYDLTKGEKAKSLDILKNQANANITTEVPLWLADQIAAEVKGEKNPISPDFIIVLGQDADSTNSGTQNPKN